MTYAEFETNFLQALVKAADANPRGQVDAASVASEAGFQVSEQWVRDAVKTYEMQGYVGPLSRTMNGKIALMITGAGRKAGS